MSTSPPRRTAPGKVLAHVAVATALAAVRLLRAPRRHQWHREHAVAPIPEGKCHRIPITWVNRKRDFNLSALGLFRTDDTQAVELDFHEGVLNNPNAMLFCFDTLHRHLVFVEVTDVVSAVNEFPFLDRAIRVLTGAHMIRVPYQTAIRFAEDRFDYGSATGSRTQSVGHSREKFPEFAIMWNTGRCGSTLMHRMMQKLGVCSFSEPYWFDQLSYNRKDFDDADIVSLLRTGLALDFSMTLRHEKLRPRNSSLIPFALGPKTVLNLLPQVEEACGGSCRHMFMYRDAAEVAESFLSIFRPAPATWTGKLKSLIWPRRSPPTPDFEAADASRFTARSMLELVKHSKVPLPEKSAVAEEVVNWIDLLSAWLEYTESRSNTFTLGFRDFVHKDKRNQLVTSVKEWLAASVNKNTFVRNDMSDDEATQAALQAFGSHSQAGSPMENSSHNAKKKVAKFLSSEDVAQINASVRSVPHLACLIREAHGKEQVVLPSSWGQ